MFPIKLFSYKTFYRLINFTMRAFCDDSQIAPLLLLNVRNLNFLGLFSKQRMEDRNLYLSARYFTITIFIRQLNLIYYCLRNMQYQIKFQIAFAKTSHYINRQEMKTFSKLDLASVLSEGGKTEICSNRHLLTIYTCDVMTLKSASQQLTEVLIEGRYTRYNVIL